MEETRSSAASCQSCPNSSAALPSPASVGFRLGFYQSHRRHIHHCLFLLTSPRRVPNLLPSRCMMSASSLGKSTSRSHHNNPLWFQSPQHPTPHPRKRKPASPPRPRLTDHVDVESILLSRCVRTARQATCADCMTKHSVRRTTYKWQDQDRASP